ncbi:sugar ABC transporter ATP-binding protein [Spirillospora sp. NPDC046719]
MSRAGEPALEIRSVTKVFGGTVAVGDVSLTIGAGTIHSFVGENGAGKSTLLGMLAGRLAPTRGEIRAFGSGIGGASPRAARAAGIVAIYQELTIIPTMSAMANVFLADPDRRSTVLDRARMRRRFAELARQVGSAADPDEPARDLSVAERQLLEVMRALDAHARVIVFDEPTAPLPPTARERLLRLMGRLRDQGVTVIFVSHHLDEVLAVSDEVTVFRDGRVVASRPGGRWTRDRLIEAMLGEDAAQRLRSAAPGGRPGAGEREEVLAFSGITVAGAVDDVSLTLRRGEILGVAGLVGAGRSTLLRAIAGLEPGATGRMTVHGAPGPVPRSVRHALRLGIGLLPEDRKELGLVGGMTAADNIAMGRIGAAARLGWTTRAATAAAVRDLAARFGVRPEYLSRPARTLSGGNQQKLLLARWALRRPAVLLADEPTRGVDVGAKRQIRDSLRALADDGMSVVMVSSEHEELLESADRLIVLAEGRVTAELDNSAGRARESDVLTAAFAREPRHVA